MTQSAIVPIAGAGPAGLAAAIVLARAGIPARVYERQLTVGFRFHGDFQGLENWTTEGDVLEELNRHGIEPSFGAYPVREVVLFGPDGRTHRCRDTEPLFYLVRRGGGPDTFDSALLEQARDAGAEVFLGATSEHLPHGGIVALGPRRADVIAAGYVFETDAADAAFVAVSRALAGTGYAYLLVHGGRATLACCLFDDFHSERTRLAAAVDFFERATGIRVRRPRFFGGSGCVSVPRRAAKGNVLYAGEAAGFQDAFAGFGIRYALVSGALAARAFAEGNVGAYEHWWRRRLGGLLRAGIVNRWLFASGGESGSRLVLRGLQRQPAMRRWMRRRYGWSVSKAMLYPVAATFVARRAARVRELPGCDCTWCRCRRR